MSPAEVLINEVTGPKRNLLEKLEAAKAAYLWLPLITFDDL